MKKVINFIAVIVLLITGVVIINSFKASASNKLTDFDNVFGGSWDLYTLPNAGNQDDNWYKPEFKKDGVRLIENQLIGDGGKKYTITTGTQLPVYSSGLGGYRTHTIEGHFVKDMSTGKEDYYTSRGCINNVSYCAEVDHGMHSGTPGNNSFMRYQMDSPDKNFSALNACGPQDCVFAHRKYANDRYYLKITTYPTNKRDLRQEVVSTVGDNGEILTFVRILNNSNQRIPHIRIGAEITLGSGESYQFTGTGFNGLNIKALDANNNRNLPKFFKPISGATLYASKWDNNNIDDITQNVNSARCKDVGAVVNQGKARGLYFIADQTSIEASNTLEFSYMTSFKSEKEPDNVVHKTYVDQETGNFFSKEDQRGSSCERYEKDIREIKGYEFINTSGDPASGNFDGDPKNVTYNYKRKTLKAVAKFVDENGNTIEDDFSVTGRYGERVTLDSKEIKGYRYKRWTGYSASGNSPSAQITILDSTHSTASGKENIVTFHYEKKKEFTVLFTHYLNEGIGGNLKVEEKTLYAGDYYDLNDFLLDMPGIKFVKADHEMHFEMPYQNISITLTYEKITTKIIVKFVDDLNRKIAEDVIYEGKYEKNQKIVDKKITGYFIDPDKTQPNYDQVFGLEDKILTFYYDRQTVKFNVIHKDEKNNIIEQKQVEYKYLDEYDESKKLDNDDYIFVKDSNNTTGIVVINQKDIIFEYRKKIETSINVKYVNEKNEVLDTLIINGKEGDTYEIPKKEFTGYKFISSSESLSGVFNDENKEIILVYGLIDVTITLNYIEEIDKENILTEKTFIKGKYGESYTLPEPKDITDYIFVRINSEKTGTFKTNMDVSYFYRKPKDSQVKVQYYNDANKKLTDDIIIEGKEGQPYQTEQKEFKGHTFKEIKGDSPSGVFGVAGKTITYMYSRNEYTITIKHIVPEINLELAQERKSGKYDTKYTSNPQEFEDYILVKTPENAQGIYKEENEDVIYEYRTKKDYQLKVLHVDDRNQVFYSETIKGKEGSEYTTDPIEKEGYIFDRVEGEPKGVFSDESSDITYYYHRVDSKLTVKYLGFENKDFSDEGKTIKGSMITLGKYLDEYDIQIPDISYYEYQISDKDLKGEYGLEDKTITLKYYHKDAQVKVKYVNDKNETLAEKIIEGKQGEEYTTEQKEFEGHEFVEVEGEPTGIFNEDVKEVVYYYDRIKTTITFRHLELTNEKADPKVLADDIVLENKYQEAYNHIPQEIKYYDFVEADQELKGSHGLEDITINLLYKQKDGQVKVKYVNDKNEVLAENIIEGKQGEEYTTEQKEFEGHEFVEVEGEPTGIFNEDVKEVVYYYDRIKTTITFRHLELTNEKADPKVLADDIVLENKYHEAYNHTPQEIKYYDFVEADQELKGSHGLEDITINLLYKQKDGQVKIKYVNDKNEVLAENIIEGKQGEEYTTGQKEFEGHEFVEVEGEPTGIFNEDVKEVVYYYDRMKSVLTIKYLDAENDEELLKSKTITGKYLDKIKVKVPRIDGYVYQGKNDLQYTFSINDQDLILMYKKDKNINTVRPLPNTGNLDLTIFSILSITLLVSSLVRKKNNY